LLLRNQGVNGGSAWDVHSTAYGFFLRFKEFWQVYINMYTIFKMNKGKFGIHGVIHEKDKTGFYGAKIAEIGLFTQARTLKKLSESIIAAFHDLSETEFSVSVDLFDEGGFLLSSAEIQSFYAVLLKLVRGDQSYRAAMNRIGEKSTAAISRYELVGGTTPSLSKAIELLQGLGSDQKDHILAWIPRKPPG
jgi:hypothetical protein